MQVKFGTIGGSTVTWTLDAAEPHKQSGSWTCEGCGDSSSWAKRADANKHAAVCRAR
jgi:hypothetical protein